MTESRRRRVQQKGRFTITEIIPGSPSSARMSSPTFLDDEVPGENFSASTDDTSVLTTVNCSEVASLQLHQQLEHSNNNDTLTCTTAVGPAQEPLSPPTEVMPREAAITIATDVAPSAVNSMSKVPIPAVTCATTALGSPSRKYSSPKKMPQRTRRIKRRGRFTIIEMASDSPTSRKNADDVYDHRYVTTTLIEETAAAMPLQLENVQPNRCADNLERRTKPKRATRSMSRLQKAAGIRRFRRRSESPTREGINPVNIVTSNGSGQQQQGRANLQILPVTKCTNTLIETPTSAGAYALAGSSKVVSMTSVSVSDNESTVVITPTSSDQIPPSSRVPSTKCCLVKPPQSSITISTAQFLQQQQTIASLIRQQHGLKQIIGVLQEQQQQLLIIPSQINDLKLQNLHVNYGETRDNEMRELHKKVDKLTATNESLHSLINAADREARHRALEIECLSEENDELRHRCGQLETRYMNERKQGFVLEEEVQRLRMLSLTLQEPHLCQQQQQSQK